MPRNNKSGPDLKSLLIEHEANPKSKPRKQLQGQRFGRLTVLGNPRSYGKIVYWVARCDCGNFKIANTAKLRGNEVRSCGCLEKENRISHGMTESHKREYASWASMRHRCDNPKSKDYCRYGQLGVTYCDRWKHFPNFVEDMGRRPEGKTLDRYHPDWRPGDKPLNYSLETCRWASVEQQMANLKNNNQISIQGVTLPCAQWAKKIGISRSTLLGRIARNWPDERLLSPSNKDKYPGTWRNKS